MTEEPTPQVWPTLRANDARGLIRFLVEAFGFDEVVVYGEGDAVEHAELAWPLGGGIMLGSMRRPATGADSGDGDGARAQAQAQDFGPTRPGYFSAYVVTDDPDGLYKRAKDAGATITRELHDTDYGSRDFAAADPEGNNWSFGTYPGHPRQP